MGTLVYRQLDEIETVSTALRPVLIEQRLGDRIVERLRGAQGVLGLARTSVGITRVRALARHGVHETSALAARTGADRKPPESH